MVNYHSQMTEDKKNVARIQMCRKKKELNIMTKDFVCERKIMNKFKSKQNTLSEKNTQQLTKILNVSINFICSGDRVN